MDNISLTMWILSTTQNVLEFLIILTIKINKTVLFKTEKSIRNIKP